MVSAGVEISTWKLIIIIKKLNLQINIIYA